jgi:hypothetical protein
MKIIKTASGKRSIKLSKSEWQSIGKKAGWMKESQLNPPQDKIVDAGEAELEKYYESIKSFKDFPPENDVNAEPSHEALMEDIEGVVYASPHIMAEFETKDMGKLLQNTIDWSGLDSFPVLNETYNYDLHLMTGDNFSKDDINLEEEPWVKVKSVESLGNNLYKVVATFGYRFLDPMEGYDPDFESDRERNYMIDQGYR